MKEKQKRYKLDNAANIYPAITTKEYPQVYRVTAILIDDIDKKRLQRAVEETIPFFPSFCVRIRKGIFWHYFEENNAVPIVKEEDELPCSHINDKSNNGFIFRVLYYKNRIHFEAFHALTDGTGAFQFLKAICYRYCQMEYPTVFSAQQHIARFGLKDSDIVQDGYLINYSGKKKKIGIQRKSYHISGEEQDQIGIISAIMPIDKIKAESKKNNVSISEYLTAVIIYAVWDEYVGSRNERISVSIPVNLRPIFGMETVQNFFSCFRVSVDKKSEEMNFDELLAEVKNQYFENIKRDRFEQNFSMSVLGEKNPVSYYSPLILKNLFLQKAYKMSSNHTVLFSNLGVLKVEDIFKPYIKGFRCVVPITKREPLKLTACTYDNELCLTFISKLTGNYLAHGVIKRLTSIGIQAIIEAR